MRKACSNLASYISSAAGSPYATVFAFGLLLVWLLSGPMLGFSETWQLLINTTTTIITFLMVFSIQHSENKNSLALQAKLDELISATDSARDQMIDVEDRDEEEIQELRLDPPGDFGSGDDERKAMNTLNTLKSRE